MIGNYTLKHITAQAITLEAGYREIWEAVGAPECQSFLYKLGCWCTAWEKSEQHTGSEDI